MSQGQSEIQYMQKALESQFLYKNDEDSLHILMSLIENEYRIKKLKPKYTCMLSIKRSVQRALRGRQDRKEILSAIIRILSDDINRLEFAVYIEAYSLGFQDKRWTDQLEMAALEQFSLDDLYDKKILFHNQYNSDILVVKNRLMDYIENEVCNYKELAQFTKVYCKKVIYLKIMRLNSYLHRQLVMWEDKKNHKTLYREPAILVYDELISIYERIVRAYIKSIQKHFKEAYWYGINDRVLNRY